MIKVDYIIQNRDGSFAGFNDSLEGKHDVVQDDRLAYSYDTAELARSAITGWLRNRTTYPTVVKRTITLESV